MDRTRRIFRKVTSHLGSPEQRWPVLVAMIAIGGLYTALPPRLLISSDPRLRWLPLLVVTVAALPMTVSHRLRLHRLNTLTAYALLVILTVFMGTSLALLIRALPEHTESATELLISAASLWLTNVLVFACWYWRLDAGGPHARDRSVRHEQGAFLFPQMTMSEELLVRTGQVGWKPSFVDYLFLAFSSSTALSPTDSPVLSRWAKMLMMIQATISFTIIVLLAARAVNTIGDNTRPPDSTPDTEISQPTTPRT